MSSTINVGPPSYLGLARIWGVKDPERLTEQELINTLRETWSKPHFRCGQAYMDNAYGEEVCLGAIAWVRPTRKKKHWRVKRCPYCKKQHLHGTDGGLGSRVPHCAENPGGREYYLLLDEP